MSTKPKTAFVFQCFKCNFECRDLKSFRAHLDSNHPRDNTYWCKTCGKGFTDRDPYFDHVEKSDCSPLFDHPCGFENCTFSDPDPARFIFHMKNLHRGKPLLPCKYCKRLFTIPFCLLMHIQEECCNRPPLAPPSNKAASKTKKETKSENIVTQVPAVTPTSKTKLQPKPVVSKSSTTPVGATNVKSNSNAKVLAVAPTSLVNPNLVKSSERQDMLFKDQNTDSDPDDPSWQPFDSDGHSNPGRSKKLPGYSEKQNRKRNAGSSNDLKSAKKIKSDEGNSISSDEEELEGVEDIIQDWTHWESKIAGTKSPDVLQKLLLPANVSDFFKCMATACSFSTNDQNDFSVHIRSEHKMEILSCCYCFKKISSCDVLVRHMVAEHVKRKYQCSACLYRACSKNHVKIHQQSLHVKERGLLVLRCQLASGISDSQIANRKCDEPRIGKDFVCTKGDCVFVTSITDDFKRHCLEKHSDAKVFSCSYCKYESTSVDSIVSHFHKHGLYQFECSFCEYGAENAENVVQHLCMNHMDKPLQISSRQPPEPPGEESDDKKRTHGLAEKFNHASTAKNFPPSPTMPRLKPFDTLPLIKDYDADRLHAMDKGENIATIIVAEDVISANQKYKWQRKLGSKFHCAVCNKSFSYSNEALSHALEVHDIVDYYKCPLCTFSTKVLRQASHHIRTVHKTKTARVVNLAVSKTEAVQRTTDPGVSKVRKSQMFLCVFCGVDLVDSCTLAEHLRSELQYNRYTCKLCKFPCQSYSEVRGHYKKCHLSVSPEVFEETRPVLEMWIASYVLAQKLEPENDETLVPSKFLTGIEGSRCKMCALEIDSESALKGHVFKHLQYFPYRCNTCDDRFCTLTEIELHGKYVHSSSANNKFWSFDPIVFIDNFVHDLIFPLKLLSSDNKKSVKTSKLKTTARKTVSKSLNSNVVQDVVRTGNVVSKHSSLKNTARKSVSKPIAIHSPEPKESASGVSVAVSSNSESNRRDSGTSSYGRKAVPVDWGAFTYYHTGLGCRLNGSCIRDIFKKEIRIVIHDVIKSHTLYL